MASNSRVPGLNRTKDLRIPWNVSHSVDGLTECTPVDGQHYSGTANEKDPWWQLDLGSIYTIKAMHLLGRPDTPWQLGGFRLWTGFDNDNLSMVYKNNETDYNNGNIWVNNTIIARTIRIDLPRNLSAGRLSPRPLVLWEVEVLISRAEVNLKLASFTSCSGIYQSFGPHLAIDGKYPSANAMTPELCNCCSITTGSGTLWWTIDFGQSQLIRMVSITGRMDVISQNQSKDLSIFVSSARPEPSSERFGDFVWNITSSESGNFFQHTFFSPRLFRFMSVTRHSSSTHYMTICEVDFTTADCQTGHYGSICNETCGQCMGGTTTCSVTDGTCPHGCAPGYSPSDKICKTECQPGRYGFNCSDYCGHCIPNTAICSVSNGKCPNGCSPGYDYTRDQTCKTEENILQQAPGVLRTSQSSQYEERNSSLAVDGRTGTDLENCNCCSQTLNYELSWWQVDIGVTVPIQEIVIHGRLDDDRYQQLSGFSVYLSTSGHFSDTPFMTVPRSDFNVTYHIDVEGRYTRYVRIQRPGVLTICEVEVFQSEKSCLKKTFSLKCIPCGHCNSGLPCDVITGQCENGCHEGYTGELCTIPVEVKSYVGLLVGSALGGAVLVLVAVGIVALLTRKRLLSLEQSRSTKDYDCPKSTSDANSQNIYDALDMSDPPISEQNVSPLRNYVNTNDLKNTTTF